MAEPEFSGWNMRLKIDFKLMQLLLNVISCCAFFLLLYKNIPFLFSKSFDEFVFNSDYFINYTSGFIKRGIDGQIIYNISQLSGFSSVDILRTMYLVFFVILSGIVINILLRSKVPLYFILSPFLFIFPFAYFPLFHISKDMEVLILAYIVLFLFINKKNNWLFNIVFSISILVHEEIFIFLFFPLLLLHSFYYSNGDFWERTKSFCIILLPSTVVFFLIMLLFNGLSNDIDIIKDSWKSHSPYLKHVTFNSGLFDGKPRIIFETVKETHNQLGFALLIVINFIFVTAATYLFSRRHFGILFSISALQILPTILLCFIASDFGRWFYIPNVILLFSIFLFRNKEPSKDFTLPGNEFILKMYNVIALPAIFLFYILGGMPYGGFNIYRYFYSNPINIIFNWVN